MLLRGMCSPFGIGTEDEPATRSRTIRVGTVYLSSKACTSMPGPGALCAAGAAYSRFSRPNVGGLEALRKGWNQPLPKLILPQSLPKAIFRRF